ncbi:Crp/Fnr family transcriptional regulator [Actinomadura craniellae]|uniref:Crp/Fnr family transcriptional regulator n=1 Tax=Actinomadura craniellae TaxID=2231787 RepID=A0A365H5W6_9ACTN|nr:Crp/Fnr family transcriptional regulator [Actinomadura craniellae]RAY14439.1 Crp/Fnr family transcriptional regulator [Actinomadura craniellae]
MSPIERGSFLADLTPEERADLEQRGRVRPWDRGEVLFREGEPSGWVAILLSGRVKASSHGLNGGEVLLAVRGPGALMGEISVIDGLPRSATVSTMEPVEALVVNAADFLGFLAAHSRVSLLIMRMLCARWRDADRKRVEFGMYDATGRVAQRLVELAERYGVPYRLGGAAAGRAGEQPQSLRITLNISQEELAGWVGASREAVSKALRTLRAHGWIETGRRSLIVHDLQALRRHAR